MKVCRRKVLLSLRCAGPQNLQSSSNCFPLLLYVLLTFRLYASWASDTFAFLIKM